jgi:hypothetical protein
MRPFPVLRTSAAIGLGFCVLLSCQDSQELTQPSTAITTITYRLTVSGTGTGSGRVTSAPAGISCTIVAGVPATSGCSALFNQGVTVKLSAQPNLGHAFGGWAAPCSGRGDCFVLMNAAKSRSAEFRKGPFTIRIVSGNTSVGTGRVRTQSNLTPAINCLITNGVPAATGCSATYPANTILTLSATPDPAFVFAGWTAPGCGTGSCQYIAIANQIVPVTFSPAVASTPSLQGRWSQAFTTPVVNVHMHLLPTGRVLLWGDQGQAQLWDPANSSAGFIPVTKTFRMYCSGHTFLRDGRLLVVGGTSASTRGLRFATVFDPTFRTWSGTSSMAQGRYYPTTTTLPNGDILAVSGHDTTLTDVTIPEVWNGSSWRRLTAAPLGIPDPYYPAMFVAPNGKVFLAGFPATTRYLDVAGNGLWTTVATRRVANRTLGSAVMYAPGKILYAGGGDPPTASAEVIDLNQAAPSWRTITPMHFARRQMNATILADGSVLVTGGTSAPGFNNLAGAVYFAELWNPKTETWRTMARETRVRTYHSTALLLPDGRVLSSGGGEGGGVPFANSELSAQVFTPPYLFNTNGTLAARPTVTLAPTRVSYGQSFLVQTPNAASVTRGSLIRLSSVTHAFNQSQLVYPLTFALATANVIRGTAPARASLAPPGPYMLFLINGAGVPSVAKIVMIGP